MNPSVIALIMLAVVFGGALFGLWLQKVLPDQHLTTETKEVVRLTTALVATISALVLSLLVSSAKSSFDRFDDELTQDAARVVMLDRTLDEYGPQADAIRVLIKSGYARRIELLFSSDAAAKDAVDGSVAVALEENIDSRLFALTPTGPVQQGLQARAVELNGEINMTRALIHAQRAGLHADSTAHRAGGMVGLDLCHVWIVRAPQCGGGGGAACVFHVGLGRGISNTGNELSVQWFD